MTNQKWQMTNQKWQMTNQKWQMTNQKWQVINQEWHKSIGDVIDWHTEMNIVAFKLVGKHSEMENCLL